MPIDRVVVSASPLIALMGINHEDLLPQLFADVFVPTAVIREIELGSFKDPNASRLRSLDWINEVSIGDIPESILGWTLRRGESEVLAYATDVGIHGR